MKYSEDNPKIELHDTYGSSITGGSGINIDRKGSFSMVLDVKNAKTILVDRSTGGSYASSNFLVEGIANNGVERVLTFAFNEMGTKYADITQYDEIKIGSTFGDTTTSGGTRTWMLFKNLKIY